MASQITVIDPSLRRVVVKVTPSTYLSTVKDEACTKLRLNSDLYMLKRNDKSVDLSVTYRLSGLPSGCKVELIQRSKSPSVISVALQIPSGLSPENMATRLINKFPSDKTLWQILRTFESGNVDGSGRSWNFTERSIKTAVNTEVYAFPRVHAMGRDYTKIEDLQKTLAQLGFNDGSVLLKVDLVPTTKTLEEAKKDMEQYLVAIEPAPIVVPSSQLSSAPESTLPVDEITNMPVQDVEASSPIVDVPKDDSAAKSTVIESRPTTVYRPPTSSTPHASTIESTDSDFEPSVDLMKKHQNSIEAATRNKRLLTDAELAASANAAQAKIAAISSIDVKIVFPDQSSVLAPFTKTDTTKELYAYVRGLLARAESTFSLSYAGAKGLVSIKEDSGERLIADLKFTGRMLVRVLWGDDVGLDVRRGPSLREDVGKLAQEIEVQTLRDIDAGPAVSEAVSSAKKEEKKSSGGGKVPKWLKLPGKK